MTKPLSVDDHLALMRKGSRDVALVTNRTNKQLFLDDRIAQLALVKAIEDIGETAGDLLKDHPDFTASETSIPWKAWKGTRNRLTHGYHNIDWQRVWNMAVRDVPALVKSLNAIDAAFQLAAALAAQHGRER